MTEQLSLFPATRAIEQPPLPMAEPLPYAALIEQASAYAPPGVTVDMCRHPSVTDPTFWLFRDGTQIGTAKRSPGGILPWTGVRVSRGMPTAQKGFVTMAGAILFAATGRADGDR